MMSPNTRRLVLTVHVGTSVAWIGAVASFLALAVVGAASGDDIVVSAVYVGMSLVGWWVIVPLSLLSALSGFVQSIGTAWGLVRHYWVLIKILITLPSIGLLFLHMQPTDMLADMALDGTSMTAPAGLKGQLVFDAAAAFVVLVVATVLSTYKPRGLTPLQLGRRSPTDGVQARPASGS